MLQQNSTTDKADARRRAYQGRNGRIEDPGGRQVLDEARVQGEEEDGEREHEKGEEGQRLGARRRHLTCL